MKLHLTPLWARVVAACVVVLLILAAGYWIKSSLDARAALKEARKEMGGQVAIDHTTAEKIHTEAKAGKALAKALHHNDEAARHDPVYRKQLDAPLPADTLRLLHDAGQIVYGPNGTVDGVRTGD